MAAISSGTLFKTYKNTDLNLIPLVYAGEKKVYKTGDFITATDICTLMLYEKFTRWKQHNVVSKNYVNIWNCLTDRLVVVPMEAIEKIDKDQESARKGSKSMNKV